ncbi:hypothetical protein CDCA_CDCA07G2023 [Cyanidium caldarium]|uniref:SWI5-dependent HO expression protein 3 n=1 Tax=Cyanidium caldarium TaxID=2771 RepID=A0AAV9IW15_CYACA|nr:hypothetical protein CDCA_CDCA07G2023 [Cyanidium caldarium]
MPRSTSSPSGNKENRQGGRGSTLPLADGPPLQGRSTPANVQQELHALERALLKPMVAPAVEQASLERQTRSLRRRNEMLQAHIRNFRQPDSAPAATAVTTETPANLSATERERIVREWRERRRRPMGSAASPARSVVSSSSAGSARSWRRAMQHHRVSADFSKPATAPVSTPAAPDTSIQELEQHLAHLLELKADAEEEAAQWQAKALTAEQQNERLRTDLGRAQSALDGKQEQLDQAARETQRFADELAQMRLALRTAEAAGERARAEAQSAAAERDQAVQRLEQMRREYQEDLALMSRGDEDDLRKLQLACEQQERVIEDLRRRWVRLSAMIEDVISGPGTLTSASTTGDAVAAAAAPVAPV